MAQDSLELARVKLLDLTQPIDVGLLDQVRASLATPLRASMPWEAKSLGCGGRKIILALRVLENLLFERPQY
jgi:hypothetical protein